MVVHGSPHHVDQPIHNTSARHCGRHPQVVRLLQLLLQFQQYQLEQGLGVQQLLREEQAEAVGLLRQVCGALQGRDVWEFWGRWQRVRTHVPVRRC